jgi:hypothetical protein
LNGSIADGKAVPYGIYDLVHNSGFVDVGIDHETAEFAVESIRRWWKTKGSRLYPTSVEMPIASAFTSLTGIYTTFTKKVALQMLKDVGYEVLDYHYTARATEIPTNEIPRNLMKLPRRLLFAIHKDLAARILGDGVCWY